MPAALTIEEKRERNMQRVAEAQAEAAGTPINTPESVDRNQRRRGVFNGTNSKLHVEWNQDDFHPHWMNDEKGRVSQALSAGYQFVHPSEVNYSVHKVTGANVDLNPGERICVQVGVTESGEPMMAYLMKIRKDWYEEDQQLIQTRIDKVDATIKAGKNTKDGTSADGFYVPQNGIQIKSSTNPRG